MTVVRQPAGIAMIGRRPSVAYSPITARPSRISLHAMGKTELLNFSEASGPNRRAAMTIIWSMRLDENTPILAKRCCLISLYASLC